MVAAEDVWNVLRVTTMLFKILLSVVLKSQLKIDANYENN